MKLIEIPKIGFKHKLGNAISGLLTILDGLIMFISLGNLASHFQLRWNMYRRSKNFLI